MVDQIHEKTEEIKQPEAPKQVYRYACPSCTGIAFYTEDPAKPAPVSHCANCGKVVGVIQKENFIALTEDEGKRLQTR